MEGVPSAHVPRVEQFTLVSAAAGEVVLKVSVSCNPGSNLAKFFFYFFFFPLCTAVGCFGLAWGASG